MTKIFLNGIVSLIMLGSLWALPASAQSPDSKTATPEAEPAAGSGPSQFGGPSSVGGTLNRDSEAKAAVPTRVHVVDQYLDFKKWRFSGVRSLDPRR